MSAREQLEQLGIPSALLDAFEHDILSDAADTIRDRDDGTCGCGCWCSERIDPDVACPQCKGDGGYRLGQACYLCGLERTKPEDPPRPSIIPTAISQAMFGDLLAAALLTQPLRPRYTGVLEYLSDGKQ